MNLPQRTAPWFFAPFLMAVAVLSLACSDDEPFEGSQPPAESPTVAGAASPPSATVEGPSSPPEAETPEATPPATPEAPASGLPAVNVERVFGDLSFERMTGLYQDFAGNWYVTEQQGRIQRIDGQSGAASLWLDITDRVDDSGNEMGLLGFALAPGFETSREFYVDYTGGGQTVVARYTASPDFTTADETTEQRLLTMDQPFANHNGGQIAFGPDGYLYVSLGDGGGGNDPSDNGQDLGTLLGSILRIDVSGDASPYGVPDDNPFANQAGARGEIWAFGLRNPWRFSFDHATGEMWAGDVGQNAREEIDLIVRGGNYGWRVLEGAECRGGGTNCDSTGMLPPVFDYATGSGGTCSVTGGFVYRGGAIPALRGAYVFSDYCSGVIYALRAPDGVLTEQAEIASTGLRVSSFAEDTDGELYVLDLSGGGIYQLVP